jgi:hypothetical protein
MTGGFPAFHDMDDDALRAKLDASRKRFVQDPTPENRDAYELAFKVFSDWVLRKKVPQDCQANESGES